MKRVFLFSLLLLVSCKYSVYRLKINGLDKSNVSEALIKRIEKKGDTYIMELEANEKIHSVQISPLPAQIGFERFIGGVFKSEFRPHPEGPVRIIDIWKEGILKVRMVQRAHNGWVILPGVFLVEGENQNGKISDNCKIRYSDNTIDNVKHAKLYKIKNSDFSFYLFGTKKHKANKLHADGPAWNADFVIWR